MNGHPRRATDMISRLSKSTIDVLSFYIGFVKEFKVKMIVVDEIMTFARFFPKNQMFLNYYYLILGSFGDLLLVSQIIFVIEQSKF